MDERIRDLTDWAVAHGILMQSKARDGFYEHAPITLEAIPFPSQQYARAIELAAPFNSLVESISRQPQWLLDTLAPVEAKDSFTAQLMALLREVMTRGEAQRVHLGMHRRYTKILSAKDNQRKVILLY